MALQQDTVVLVHGLAASRLMMKPIETHLRQCGFDTLNWGYPSIRGDIERHARRLSKTLQQLEQSPAINKICLVTHSMGGIVARTALLQTRLEKVSRLVMLGPPNHGSRVATVLAQGLGWLCKPLSQLSDTDDSFVNQLPPPGGIEIGIIAALFDRVVAIDSTHLSTELEHRVIPSGHNSMLFRRDVASDVANFLSRGRFAAQSSEGDFTRHSSRLLDPPLTMLTVKTVAEPSRTLPSPSST